jgi:hypothetical protein
MISLYNPNVRIDESSLSQILRALDRQISILGQTPIGLVVCGGSALAALGLVMRTTKDVDVLAAAAGPRSRPVIAPLPAFPDWLVAAAARVARDFGLPADWLNLGPARQIEMGLPAGLARRLTRRAYGRHLSIYYISRLDQIHLKLYAAVDQDGRHTDDLAALHPSPAELRRAARWVLTQDVSPEFRHLLLEFLDTHGYVEVTQSLS